MYNIQLIEKYQTLKDKIESNDPQISIGEFRAYNLLNYFLSKETFNIEEEQIAKGLVAKMLKNKKLLN